jgi:hypothetical protein
MRIVNAWKAKEEMWQRKLRTMPLVSPAQANYCHNRRRRSKKSCRPLGGNDSNAGPLLG